MSAEKERIGMTLDVLRTEIIYNSQLLEALKKVESDVTDQVAYQARLAVITLLQMQCRSYTEAVKAAMQQSPPTT